MKKKTKREDPPMKFSDGCWLTRNGYAIRYATQTYEICCDTHSVSLLTTPQKIYDRGMTLGGANLEITLSSHAPDIIKVRIEHHRGGVDHAPKYELNEDQGYTPVIRETENAYELISGETRAVISKGDYGIDYYYRDKKLTGVGRRTTSYIEESAEHKRERLLSLEREGFWGRPYDTHGAYMREQLFLDVGECIYGFGEKFTPFVKNGQVVELWNADGGTSTEQSYKSIPFYLSSRGYGVFVNDSDRVSFEVGSEAVSRVSFSLPGEHLEYFLIGGKDLCEVLENYTDLTGKPSLPPAYTFGLWLSTSFLTKYDEETVLSFIDGMARRNIPLQVFHFDCFWMKEFEWCGFEWDKRQFPDPEAMLKRLRDRGLGICCWINPYIAQRSALFDEGAAKGYFIKKEDGSVFQTDSWQPGMAIVDFTNPDACRWFGDKIRALCRMGVTCIKTDFGERIPTKVTYFDGSDPIKMHNYYTYLYNKTVFEVLEEVYGKNQACLFARSATAGSQKFPVHWGGDCTAEYVSMAETLRGGLSLCASGFGYFSHDISGFETTATPDLYKRWCAFGLMSSHSRLHGSTSYRVPWFFDEESCDVLRFFTELKGKLMPYLFAQAVKTSTVGVPMMRPMVLQYASEPAALTCDKQYMFGDDLLIAPVLSEDGTAEFYLPEGIWTDILTEETVCGGKYIRRKCSYTEIPAYARPGSVIAYGNFCGNFEYDYLSGTEFVIYGLSDGKDASTVVYDTEANEIFRLAAHRNGETVTVCHTKTDKSFSVRVAGEDGLTLQLIAE